MAKAKSGGTRSFLRGRIASDVYSIGKDGKGKKQQVVRSLAETVANPQTTAQMRGRMIMSTVMQAVSAMSEIIDHSFDDVAAGQPNVSEFIRRNYALIKADVAAHPASDNEFGLNLYREKGVKNGAYVVSAGSAQDIQTAVIQGTSKMILIPLSESPKVSDLRSALGLGIEDYFTVVSINLSGKFVFCRMHINQSIAADTVISAENVAEIFTFDGNVTATPTFADETISIALGDLSANAGIIVSRKSNGAYIHNNCVLASMPGRPATADVALPTYPTGSQRFLNGGDENIAYVAAASSNSPQSTTPTGDGGGSSTPGTGSGDGDGDLDKG